jgi:hypothetical protein
MLNPKFKRHNINFEIYNLRKKMEEMEKIIFELEERTYNLEQKIKCLNISSNITPQCNYINDDLPSPNESLTDFNQCPDVIEYHKMMRYKTMED